jgi:flavodoxin
MMIERHDPMSEKYAMSRRDSFRAALLPLAASGLTASAGSLQARGNGDTVVVYLSRSGNTRVLAEALSRRVEADLFEVRPRDPWPEDYEEMVDWASRMRETGEPIALADTLDTSGYRTVFLGFPIWGGDLPAVMASFLRSHDLAGKTVVPFITHGGYGEGEAMATVGNLVPSAEFLDPFVLRCDQERDTLRRLEDWLESEVVAK